MGADEVSPGFNLDPSTPQSDASPLHSSTDISIVQTLQNVTLENTHSNDLPGDSASDDAKDQYPLRPYAEDCAFYIRTGHCKFRLFCKFNHPVKRPNQGAKDKEKNEFVEQTTHIECKYFRTAAGCKFGDACRYKHSKEQTETPELNFLGLPIRQGEIVCPFYIRHGSCGYGATCRFHHPDPTDVEGSDSYNFTPPLQSMGGLNDSFANHDGEYDPSLQLGTSQPTVASHSLHTLADETVSYLDDHLSKAPVYPKERPWQNNLPLALDNSIKTDVSTYHQQPKELDEFPERPGQPDCDYFMKTGYCKFRSACKYHHPKTQDSKLNLYTLNQKKFLPKPFYPQEKAWKINSALGVDIFKKKTDVSGYHQPKIDVEEFPERPGQPDCAFYIKTGDCIYKSACRYHHPRNRVSTLPVCALSDKGLPLRPDRKICWHYEQYGICKFGRSCLFDHPMNHCPSASPVGLDPPLPSSSYAASFGGTRMDGSGAESEILISQSV